MRLWLCCRSERQLLNEWKLRRDHGYISGQAGAGRSSNYMVSEATGFTPWLGRPENLQQLAEALGIDLELEAQEQFVGPFRADLLCKDTATDRWVL